MKGITTGLIASAILFDNTMARACTQCRPSVEAGVYNQDFVVNLSVLLLPVAVLFVIGLGIYFAGTIKTKIRRDKKNAPWQMIYDEVR